MIAYAIVSAVATAADCIETSARNGIFTTTDGVGAMAIELNLAGKRVLITGGSEGIGRAIAHRLAGEGCNLYLAARTEARLEGLREELIDANGVDIGIFPLDLGVSGVASSLRVPTGAESTGPIVVERVRVMGAGQIVTRHDTVVRQGDRILAIVKGNQEGEMGFTSNVLGEGDLYR